MSTTFIPHGPTSAKVECSICGRFGYEGGRWQEKCREGHPHADPCHDRMWATRSQRASHVKPRRRAGGAAMTGFTPGELLALYAILTTSRAPGAPKLAEKVRREYETAHRATTEGEVE